MKFFQQTQSGRMVETHLNESDHVCAHCQEEDHWQVYKSFPDDAECKECHSLCNCGCHRQKKD